MDKRDDEFLKRLLATFKAEADDHIKALSSGLMELKKSPNPERQMEIIETIFREAHSLKGAARAVNIMDIESVCQALESLFSALKHKEIFLSPELINQLQNTVDHLAKLLLSMDAERSASDKSRVRELIKDIEGAIKSIPPTKTEKEETPAAPTPEISKPTLREYPLGSDKPVTQETVRISINKLNSMLLKTEELISVKLMTGQRLAELREINYTFALLKKEWAKNRNQRSGNKDLKMTDSRFPDANSFTTLLETRLTALQKAAEHDHRSIGNMVDDIIYDMKKVLMLPFSSLLEGFPRFVRELSREQGKEVDFVVQGGDIEIDRHILEEMKDPLIHLVRNCIDHGIETPSMRKQKEKPQQGDVTLSIFQKNSSKVEIVVFDDGAGIDVVKVRLAAVKRGIISHEEVEKMNEQEALSLIFQSGVSTSPIITDISGRGLGLAIVQDKVEKMSGKIFIETKPDMGTTFRIVLPLTLATFKGIIVSINEHLFVIPMINVERVMRIKKEEIKTVENRETIQFNGKTVSLIRLEDVLKLGTESRNRESRVSQFPTTTPLSLITDSFIQVVVLCSSEKRIAFQVDEVLHEQEVLVKSLGRQLSRVQNIAGATVLEAGKVVSILNVPDLMKSAVRVTPTTYRDVVPVEEIGAERKSILVVEDSITARSLLKNILESAGYNIKTAVDGIDAFTILKIENFNLVVSDVDMPRMNGFDLTAKIRSDKKLADLPVVLVTALESREDREHGIDVGANAYIVKSRFDQSNLLEVIKRLI